MVVAEVPLWVIHNNSGTTAQPDHSNTAATTAKHAAGAVDPTLVAARDSLRLLQPSNNETAAAVGGLRSTKKCAVYSIDVHPKGRIFATAGGDGTVRLWNARALFPTVNGTTTAAATTAAAAAARFDAETGAYVSSDSSASESSSSRSSPSDDNEGKNNVNAKPAPVASEEDSSSSSADTPAAFQTVHDLNAVARRKRDGSTAFVAATSSPPRANGNNTDNAEAAPTTILSPLGNSPQQPRNSKGAGGYDGNHHHHHQHRLLCTLSAHTGSSVLAVRFSTSGQYLASAGDDACVCIYAPSLATSTGMTSFSGNLVNAENKSLEHWSRIKLCRGHGLDVVDLAWAPDDSHLVSCSLDSATPIIVWKLTDLGNSGSTRSKSMICNPFKVLGQSVHTSTVKGVTFDPAGSYFASSGDDPAVCIWRAHDDWGLEKRIDADTGIFRKWGGSSSGEYDVQALSSQSLFRRISWSTDGAFVCSTNSVVKNKHVASTISREGWSVSGAAGQSAGAANLVGHKQPVVVSRHATQLLDSRKRRGGKPNVGGENGSKSSKEADSEGDDESEDDEPEYATLLALGDRRGFVTVWSTRKSRPIFKLQCSESHCTVTDLAWGALGNGDIMLLVSLLDGQVVALRFSVPDELGALLSKKDKARVFQLRYGIDMEVDAFGGVGQRRLFVGGHSGPKLIENALQMTLEEDRNVDDEASMDEEVAADKSSNGEVLLPRSVKDQQQESRSQGGKKRIRPVLLVGNDASGEKRPKSSDADSRQQAQNQSAASTDPLQNAMEAAERAVAAAESGNATRKEGASNKQNDTADAAAVEHSTADNDSTRPTVRGHHRLAPSISSAVPLVAALPHSTERIHCVDLPPREGIVLDPFKEDNEKAAFVAECVNVMKVPTGSKGVSIPCIDISISHGGCVSWKDQIPGTSCSAMAASRNLLAIGTADGSIQLFGSSPTLGWTCGSCFRSHAPLILGHPIVLLQLKENKSPNETPPARLEMLVVTSDGGFGVWTVLPELCLQYKGSVMPAMTHMSLGSSLSEELRLPKLARVQFTDLGRLFLLLSFDLSSTNRLASIDRASSRSAAPTGRGPGGSLQGFVYDRGAELWFRVSDSRFVLSDFYSALPSSKSSARGVLCRMDDAVRMGSLQSSLKAAQRGHLGDRHADGIYDQGEDDSSNCISSRSHCEDRMACALAMHSASEFKHWLALYVRMLVMRGHISHIRMLVDMLLGRTKEASSTGSVEHNASWWLSGAPTILKEDRKQLIKSLVIPELSKSRALQRITNEISLEVDLL